MVISLQYLRTKSAHSVYLKVVCQLELSKSGKNLLSRWAALGIDCAQSLSRVRLFETPWTVVHQSPLSMGILQARILEWVAMPSSGDFPNPGIKPRSPTLQTDSLISEPSGKLSAACLLLLGSILLLVTFSFNTKKMLQILFHALDYSCQSLLFLSDEKL